MSGGWARYAIERLRLLKRWRELVPLVAKACRDVLKEECVRIYVVGGAAEDRLTVLSDIDVVIIVGNPELKNLGTLIRIKRRAEELGVPPELPLDIKIMTEKELRTLAKKGVYRKLVEVSIEEAK